MNSTEESNPVLDMDALCVAEQTCRQRVEQEPADTGARLRWAWCLLARAFHESGRESSYDSRPYPVEAGTPAPSSARLLLASSLKQVMLVLQISADPQEQREAQRLRSLVSLSGGKQSLQEADEEASRILSEITRALLYGIEGDSLGMARSASPLPSDMRA